MSTLLVCHSTGDTEIILDTARAIVSESKEPIYILTVGQAATAKVKQDPLYLDKNITVIPLTQMFGEAEAKAFENAPLTIKQLKTIQECLAKLHIDRALFGTPSQMSAAAPFQIAEQLADKLREGVIYNDYLYFEEGHSYWKTLHEHKPWQLKFKWGVPTQDAKKLVLKYNPSVDVRVVGHRAIDAAAAPKANLKWDSAPRTHLGVGDKQSLIFVSGSKNSAEDKVLLNELLAVIEINHPKYSQVEIRLGLHPGLESDLTAYKNYISTLAGTIDKFQHSSVAKQVKFIIPPAMADKIDLHNIDSHLICKMNINGDSAAEAADGVASAAPATLVNKTALAGKPAYYQQGEKTPFLPKNRLFAGDKDITLFLTAAVQKNALPAISKNELQPPTQNTAFTLKSTLFPPKNSTTSVNYSYLATAAVALAIVIVGGVLLYRNAADRTSQRTKR